MIIAHKLRRYRSVNTIVHRSVRSHIVGHLAGRARFASLLLHTCLKAVFVDAVALFFQNLLCQIRRKSIGIIQLKRI